MRYYYFRRFDDGQRAWIRSNIPMIACDPDDWDRTLLSPVEWTRISFWQYYFPRLFPVEES